VSRPAGPVSLVAVLAAAVLAAGGLAACGTATGQTAADSAADSAAGTPVSCLPPLPGPTARPGTGASARPGTGAPPVPARPSGPGSGTPAPGPAAAPPLPRLRLPCLEGGAEVELGALGRPAVVNLWASWCAPCRAEMPAIQGYAARTAGAVTVIGVDTADTGGGARSVLRDLGITYPNLRDDRQLLLHALGGAALPLTLFVDGAGRIRYQYRGEPLTGAALAGLVRDHLGGEW
jgi:thiol-disulfide isomerase/thioredoxin